MSRKTDYTKPYPLVSGFGFCPHCENDEYIIIYQDIFEHKGILVPEVYWVCQKCFEKFYMYKYRIGQYDELLGLYMLRERLNKKEE